MPLQDLHVETCPPNNVIAFDNAIQIMKPGIADRHLGQTIAQCLIPLSTIS